MCMVLFVLVCTYYVLFSMNTAFCVRKDAQTLRDSWMLYGSVHERFRMTSGRLATSQLVTQSTQAST